MHAPPCLAFPLIFKENSNISLLGFRRVRFPLLNQRNWQGVVVLPHAPGYMGGGDGRITAQGYPWEKM
jgi:hypothetical protein